MNVDGTYAWTSSSGGGGRPKRDNSPLLPNNTRGLLIGKSNCGKTTLLLNLLLQPDWLDYNHLYVFGQSLHQQEHKILKKGFEIGLDKNQISNLFMNQRVLKESGMLPLDIRGEYTRW